MWCNTQSSQDVQECPRTPNHSGKCLSRLKITIQNLINFFFCENAAYLIDDKLTVIEQKGNASSYPRISPDVNSTGFPHASKSGGLCYRTRKKKFKDQKIKYHTTFNTPGCAPHSPAPISRYAVMQLLPRDQVPLFKAVFRRVGSVDVTTRHGTCLYLHPGDP